MILRWHLQLGCSVIPRSSSPARIVENFRLFEFDLSEADVWRPSPVCKRANAAAPIRRIRVMEGFGIHSSIWTMRWTAEAAEYAVAQAVHHGFDFVEVAIPEPGVRRPRPFPRLIRANGHAGCLLSGPA